MRVRTESWISVSGFRDRLAAGTATKTLYSTLSKVVPAGAHAVRTARAQLASALDATSLPVTSAYLAPARKEANRSELCVSDVIDEQNAVRPSGGRAEDWLAGLRMLENGHEALRNLRSAVESHIKPGCGAPFEALADAEGKLDAIETPDDVADLQRLIDAAKAAYKSALRDRRCVLRGVDSAEMVRAVEARSGVEDLSFGIPRPIDLPAPALATAVVLARIATALVIAAILGLAGLTVYLAAYDAKPLFAGWRDWFALFSAMLASTAAAAALGVLAYWRPAE